MKPTIEELLLKEGNLDEEENLIELEENPVEIVELIKKQYEKDRVWGN